MLFARSNAQIEATLAGGEIEQFKATQLGAPLVPLGPIVADPEPIIEALGSGAAEGARLVRHTSCVLL